MIEEKGDCDFFDENDIKRIEENQKIIDQKKANDIIQMKTMFQNFAKSFYSSVESVDFKLIRQNLLK